jgi:hypothetical protein
VKKLIAIVASIADVVIISADVHTGHYGVSFVAAVVSLAAFLVFFTRSRRRS